MMENPSDGLIEFWVQGEPMPITFESLWTLARTKASRLGERPNDAFLSVGLRLVRPTAPWQYYCTPRNVKTFASSGKDGVHYSFLMTDRLPSDVVQSDAVQSIEQTVDSSNAPIVMTVPMNFENQNIVVAQNLREFLCLGCRAGYASLEALASVDEDFSVLKAQDYIADLSTEQQGCLTLLSETFLLAPLSNLEERMHELQTAYLDCLQLGDVLRVPSVETAVKSSEKPSEESAKDWSVWA
ncbi:MAG: hypothetical protein AAFY72_06000 [Cyanobacteria bacterium J06649_4]